MCKVNSLLYPNKAPVTRGKAGGQSHWVPNADVYVSEDGLVVKVELSGMRREDLDLAVEDNRLIITGQRPDGCRTPGVKFLVMEINYGSFECVIDIPAGYEICRAKACYQNGFLRIDVPVTRPASKSFLVPVSEGK